MTTSAIIIISEPDPMISGVLRVEFSRWNFAVLLAGSTEEAEDYASQTVASLVVLDAAKAQPGAYETCARIRRLDGYTDRPIVLTVREVSARTQAAATMAGATALLTKPYSVTDLFQAITPHLRPNDPLLAAGHSRSGVAAPKAQEWKTPAALEWKSSPESALSRNLLLMPIVRGTGQKIPVIGKIS
jgi:DNA-binding response OmpR family regulator